ncbi:hypothetical protein [Bradyrhizobium sp.]|uniref:hypothetical protein n=1 Tax=Bradyrhizobium sp. TaxID=376 RepID=UPI003C4BBCA6
MKTLLRAVLLLLAAAPAFAANEGFNTFTLGLGASTTLAGTEDLVCVQGGVSTKCTPAQIDAYVASQILGTANTWSAQQTYTAAVPMLMTAAANTGPSVYYQNLNAPANGGLWGMVFDRYDMSLQTLTDAYAFGSQIMSVTRQSGGSTNVNSIAWGQVGGTTNFAFNGTGIFSGQPVNNLFAEPPPSASTFYVPNVYPPGSAITTAAIITAANAACSAGGGVVLLPPVSIALTASLPLCNGVIYSGTGYGMTPAPGTVNPVGTVLTGNNTFPAFAYNTTALGSAQTQTAFLQSMLVGAGIMNMTIGGSTTSTSFTYGIDIGAAYNGGCAGCVFENLFLMNNGQYGLWDENFDGGRIRNVQSVGNGASGTQSAPGGQAAFVSSAGSAWVPGNLQILNLSTQAPPSNAYNTRNILIEAYNASKINALTFDKVQSNSGGVLVYGGTKQSASEISGHSCISVTDSTKFAVGEPVAFDTNANDYRFNQIYFVTAINPTGCTSNGLGIGNYVGAAAITNANTVSAFANILAGGFPGIEVDALDTSTIQPSDYTGIDIEGQQTVAIHIQGAFGQHFKGGLVPNDGSITGGNSTDGAIRTLSVRTVAGGSTSYRNEFDLPNGASPDFGFDYTTQQNILEGARFEFGAVNNSGYNTGLGCSIISATNNAPGSGFVTPLLPSLACYFDGAYQPDIYETNTSNALFIQHPFQNLVDQISAASGQCYDAYHPSYAHTNAGNDSCTLPTINAQWVGITLDFSNPQPANTWTLIGGTLGSSDGTCTTTGPQNIVQAGASANSYAIPANTNVQIRAYNNNGACYWGVFTTLKDLSGTTGSLGGSALIAGACSSTTVSITGATTGMSAVMSGAGGSDPGGAYQEKAWISSSNTVTAEVCAVVAGTPAAQTYNVRVLQ